VRSRATGGPSTALVATEQAGPWRAPPGPRSRGHAKRTSSRPGRAPCSACTVSCQQGLRTGPGDLCNDIALNP
jgi:hypothetical protein